MDDLNAEILKIQRFSINDGPGIRTTIFFKGCPLNCAWCHNPDSISGKPQLSFSLNICTYCGKCCNICPENLHTIIDGKHNVKFELCKLCGSCVDSCQNSALSIIGESMNSEKIINILQRDKDYYIESGGGITVSGGEPMLQYKFVEKLFDKSHEIGINTALDTSGFYNSNFFAQVLEKTDYLLYDLKIMDNDLHKKYTGVDNGIIHENFRYAVKKGTNIVIRHIVVPDVNDSDYEHHLLADFLCSNKFEGNLELLPYHNMGRGKYNSIGLEYSLNEILSPKKEQMEQIKSFFASRGIATRIN